MILSAITAAAGLASSIFGGIKSAQANKRERKQLAQEEAENRAIYNRDYYQDMVHRADMQYLLNKQREQSEDAAERARRTNVVAGATTATEAVQKEANRKGLTETMARIGAMSQQQKQNAQANFNAARVRTNARRSAANQNDAAQGVALQQTGGQLISNAALMAMYGGNTTKTATTDTANTATNTATTPSSYKRTPLFSDEFKNQLLYPKFNPYGVK